MCSYACQFFSRWYYFQYLNLVFIFVNVRVFVCSFVSTIASINNQNIIKNFKIYCIYWIAIDSSLWNRIFSNTWEFSHVGFWMTTERLSSALSLYAHTVNKFVRFIYFEHDRFNYMFAIIITTARISFATVITLNWLSRAE